MDNSTFVTKAEYRKDDSQTGCVMVLLVLAAAYLCYVFGDALNKMNARITKLEQAQHQTAGRKP